MGLSSAPNAMATKNVCKPDLNFPRFADIFNIPYYG